MENVEHIRDATDAGACCVDYQRQLLIALDEARAEAKRLRARFDELKLSHEQADAEWEKLDGYEQGYKDGASEDVKDLGARLARASAELAVARAEAKQARRKALEEERTAWMPLLFAVQLAMWHKAGVTANIVNTAHAICVHLGITDGTDLLNSALEWDAAHEQEDGEASEGQPDQQREEEK